MNSTILKAENITRFFQIDEKRLDVLIDVNIEISKGEMIGVVGMSGSGKSTLLHILGGLDRPCSGKNVVEGKNIFEMNDNCLADFRNRNIGFVFQSHHLMPEFTALENVMIPGLISRKKRGEVIEESRRMLNKVGLKNRENHKPGKLSGGEQQRVAIARALINSPHIIFADEPTGNLDSKTGESIEDLMRELNQTLGQTFVIVTHNDRLVKKMDRFIRLTDGKIVYNE